MHTFALGRFVTQGEPFTGVVAGARVGRLSEMLPGWRDGGIEALFADWQANVERIASALEANPELRWDESGLTRLAPLDPLQLFGAGMNYRKHVVDLMIDKEMCSREEAEKVMDERAASGTPLVFVATPTAICGPDDDIVLRPDSEESDWELELAAVIARPTRRVGREEALDCVAGWTMVNDLTARNFVPRTDAGPVSVDWLRSKCAPTYKPTGPYLVPTACAPDPSEMTLTLRLNGETMQDSSTGDMIFDVAALVSYLSHEVKLLPGDVVMTGSPAGNGTHHGRFLRDGDVLEGEITPLPGMLRNRCVRRNGA
jgi:2-keto-4-pentenoate hydratase/2-oxohepta-3-ene-1,7-dioic acid hydratase in catechol pathway